MKINNNQFAQKAFEALQNGHLKFNTSMSLKEQVQCLNNINSEGKFDALPSFMNSDHCKII